MHSLYLLSAQSLQVLFCISTATALHTNRDVQPLTLDAVPGCRLVCVLQGTLTTALVWWKLLR
jgi:hypothetical protein